MSDKPKERLIEHDNVALMGAAARSVWLARWPNFLPEEMACKGTGALKISPRLLDGLQRLRADVATTLVINSAYRSPAHNAAVGGAPNSWHVQGLAADISLRTVPRWRLVRAACAAGFLGIGLYDSFVHLDFGARRLFDRRHATKGILPDWLRQHFAAANFNNGDKNEQR